MSTRVVLTVPQARSEPFISVEQDKLDFWKQIQWTDGVKKELFAMS